MLLLKITATLLFLTVIVNSLEITTEKLNKAVKTAQEAIKKAKESSRIAARSSIGCIETNELKCPYANGNHFHSRPSSRKSRDIAEQARIFEEATKALIYGHLRRLLGPPPFPIRRHTVIIFRDPTTILQPTADGSQSIPSDVLNQIKNYELDNTALEQPKRECLKRRNIRCNIHTPYRESDGRCNNLANPTWGKSFECMVRLMDPAYNDGISEPRGRRINNRFPNPRLISAVVNSDRNVSAATYTLLLMQIGQFIDHDLALAPMEEDPGEIVNLGNPNNPIDCCSPQRRDTSECFSFDIFNNDPYYSRFGQTCMNMPRSAPCTSCQLGYREQQDALTSYIDASQIYGSTDEDTTRLRALTKGLLKFQVVNNRQHLPRSFHPERDRCSAPSSNNFCFRAGDERVNEQPGLTAMHLIWLRQHNLVADKLSKVNPRWDDEKLFQEARKIVTAQWQTVVYKEWLPIVLGESVMNQYRLNVLNSGYTVYDPSVDATMINEFASAAFRFGHTLIDGTFFLISKDGQVDSISLENNYFLPFDYYKGRLDPMLRGLLRQRGQNFDRFITTGVTNHLYRLRNDSFGLDLVALNIQRGRDHGVRPYIDYVQFCTGKRIQSFQDLNNLMPQDAVQKLQSVYNRVEEIDLFPAGVSEHSMPGAVLGPTFGCIQATQFQRAKFGDRFFFEHGNQAGSFTSGQLHEIRKTTMAKIICDNADDITQSQLYAFRPIDNVNNPRIPCSQIPRPDLTLWADQ